MPAYERDTLPKVQDALGNLVVHYILTRAANVLLTKELVTLLGTESATVEHALKALHNSQQAHNVASNAHEDLRALIAEARSIAEGRSRGVGFATYSELVASLNAAAAGDYAVGDNFFVSTADVPDLWVYSVASTPATYTYSNDAALVAALDAGPVQIGYFSVAKLEIGKVDVSGEIAAHNSSGSAHADIRALITALQNSAVKSLADLGITATAAELNKLDGVTATTAQMNYLVGVTSAIQTQLNGKAATHSHPYLSTSGGTVTGNVTVNGTITGTKVYGAYFSDSADYAEQYLVDGEILPGDLVAIGADGKLVRNAEAANPRVLGIVSTEPGPQIGVVEGGTPIALAGRVPARVVGRVTAGDFLTGSSVPGAITAAGSDAPRGAIVAQALESKDDDGEGTITVFVVRM